MKLQEGGTSYSPAKEGKSDQDHGERKNIFLSKRGTFRGTRGSVTKTPGEAS